MQIRHVAMGDAELRLCPACGGEHEVYPVFAMDITGVLPIGEVTMCHGCGEAWVCLLCATVMPADGELAHRHMAEVHAS